MPTPRKRSPLKIVLLSLAGLLVLLVGFGILGAIVGDDQEPATDLEAALETERSAAAALIPPAPDAKTAAAFVADLRKIDPAIVGDKDADILVDRGRNQCTSIQEWPGGEAKLVDLTNKRFTAPSHPDGFGDAKAKKILAAVREHICPA